MFLRKITEMSEREFFTSAVIVGAVVGLGICIAFGVLRVHEGTFLCEYLLCLE